MKIGDYVRTECGIAKCISVIPIRENSFLYEFDVMVYEENEEKVHILTASELEKYKFSNTLIDLIEIDDYVNGFKVLEILSHNPQLIFVTYKYNGHHYTKILDNEDIKSIVTKEQFENMKYKVVK